MKVDLVVRPNLYAAPKSAARFETATYWIIAAVLGEYAHAGQLSSRSRTKVGSFNDPVYR
jgi:hypothetical protein